MILLLSSTTILSHLMAVIIYSLIVWVQIDHSISDRDRQRLVLLGYDGSNNWIWQLTEQ